jgi:hypothetical protein
VETIACPYCDAQLSEHVKKCKHCGEWVKKPELTPSPHDDRETCSSCGKKMVPRIITGPPLIRGQGSWTPVPKKSLCPFCGATHKKFPPSLGEKIGIIVGIAVFMLILRAVFFQ